MRDPLRLALLGLTFVTGIVDAVAFLSLDQVFAAMMTGSVLFLGFGIAGSAGASVGLPLVAIAAFVAGGLAGGFAGAGAGGDPRRGIALATAIEVPLIAGAALLAALADVDPDEAAAYALIAMLALAMGARNTLVRRMCEPELPTTVLTVAVSGLDAAAPAAASSEHMSIRAAVVATMLAGAVAGALLLQSSIELALATGAVVTLATGLAYRAVAR